MLAMRPDTKVLPIPSFNCFLPVFWLNCACSSQGSTESDMARNKTAIVTAAQRGIGAGLVAGFLKSGYSVVAKSLRASQSVRSTPDLVVVDGDIRGHETAAQRVQAAVTHFGTVDVLVNNAGIYITKLFTEFTTDDFNTLVSVNGVGGVLLVGESASLDLPACASREVWFSRGSL